MQSNTTAAVAVSTPAMATAQLQLRVGLHSGPVTAGILRVERSRFQLLGDTGTLPTKKGYYSCVSFCGLTGCTLVYFLVSTPVWFTQ